jgi:diguanylate cyclase (GGDEF)-like protein
LHLFGSIVGGDQGDARSPDRNGKLNPMQDDKRLFAPGPDRGAEAPEAETSDPVSEAALLERLERVTRFARRLFQVPVAAISLAEPDGLKVKACQGLPAAVLGRTLRLEEIIGANRRVVMIQDAAADMRILTHPLVQGRPQIRGLAAAPLRGLGRQVRGVILVADRQPRTFGTSDLVLLKDLVALAETDLIVSSLGEARLKLMAESNALQRNALTDPLTQLWNRAALTSALEREVHATKRRKEPLSLILAGIDDFDGIASVEGRGVADLAVVEVGGRLGHSVRRSDLVGRYDDDAFLMVLPRCDLAHAAQLADRMRRQFAHRPVRAGSVELPLTLSYGVVTGIPNGEWAPEELLQLALLALAEAREAGIDASVSRQLAPR